MTSILALCLLVGLTLSACPANYAISNLQAGTNPLTQTA